MDACSLLEYPVPQPSRDRQEARELGVPGVRDHMYGYGDVQVLSESIRIIFGLEPPARQAQDSQFFLKLCGREQGSRSVERENGVRQAQGVGVLRRLRALDFWMPLEARSFRRLWAGAGLSMLADQAFLVALTWLALRVTGSGAELGRVLAVASIPGTILTPAGGVLRSVFPRDNDLAMREAFALGL